MPGTPKKTSAQLEQEIAQAFAAARRLDPLLLKTATRAPCAVDTLLNAGRQADEVTRAEEYRRSVEETRKKTTQRQLAKWQNTR